MILYILLHIQNDGFCRGAYTEAFILRVFLMNNNRYEILFFNSMMIKKYYEEYSSGWNKEHGLFGFGSIWLRKR